ncbi:unnamed protein product [Linum trigynum]|uniref:Uncharacterized protein n=1 Tax=Linum trigynum TaxID=586398 RepID=A0AAV2EW37_9ROSI
MEKTDVVHSRCPLSGKRKGDNNQTFRQCCDHKYGIRKRKVENPPVIGLTHDCPQFKRLRSSKQQAWRFQLPSSSEMECKERVDPAPTSIPSNNLVKDVDVLGASHKSDLRSRNGVSSFYQFIEGKMSDKLALLRPTVFCRRRNVCRRVVRTIN